MVAYMETAERHNGERIRRARGGHGFLNGTAFAKRLGISRQHLANIETGRSAPGRDLLVRIANELDVSVDYLLGRDEPPREMARGRAAAFETPEAA
jgi:transcriptional regulator with XRE-family HTH domain